MKKKRDNFFSVIARSQTYLNMVYLLLSFVLGIFYFVFIVIGISLGLGLIITFFGIPILFFTLLLARVFASFERQQAIVILGIKIAPTKMKRPKGLLKTVQAYLNDSFTWKSLIYTFIKFPLGIISFVALVTLIPISLSLIVTPILYHLMEIGVLQGPLCISSSGICFLNSYTITIIIGVIGILLLFVFLHMLNALAYVSGLLAKAMLGKNK